MSHRAGPDHEREASPASGSRCARATTSRRASTTRLGVGLLFLVGACAGGARDGATTTLGDTDGVLLRLAIEGRPALVRLLPNRTLVADSYTQGRLEGDRVTPEMGTMPTVG